MNLLSLNIAHGQQLDTLLPFIKTQSELTDTFCFQEVFFGHEAKFTEIQKARLNIFDELKKVLPDYTSYIYKAPVNARHFYHELLPKGVRGGLAIFVKKEINVIDNGGFRCYKNDNFNGFDFGAKLTGNCQWIDLEGLTILNLHGIYQRDTNKSDTKERILQSQIIKSFMDNKSTKKILCGDFNLLPENKSLLILEQDMINLVKKYNIKSTRSTLYEGKHKNADYILVTPDVYVRSFKTINNTVSDHLPLMIDFDA